MSPELQQEGFPFSRDYQLALLRRVVTDPDFLPSCKDIVKPEYFYEPEHRALVALAIQYFERHEKGPTETGIREMIADTGRAGEGISAQLEASLVEALMAPKDEDHDVLWRALEFARLRACELAALEAPRLIASGRLSALPELFHNAVMTGAARESVGLDYFNTPPVPQETIRAGRIQTGFPQLDDLLCGGIGPGELGVICAPSYVGKTTLLTNIMVAALRQGMNVMEYCLDSTSETVRRLRYDSVILGRNVANASLEDSYAALRAWQQTYGCKLLIKSYDNNTVSIDDLRIHLRTVVSRKALDLSRLMVMIDYGLILRGTGRKQDRGDQIERQKYLGMIKMAGEFNCPVWSAIQSKRYSREKTVIELDDLSEVYMLTGDAHIILMLSQTKRDISSADSINTVPCRVHVAKAKHRPGHRTVHMTMDHSTGRMAELPIPAALICSDAAKDSEEDEGGSKNGQKSRKPWKPYPGGGKRG